MLRLRDIMTTDVQTMSPETSIRDAMDMLVAHHIGGAPVVANRQVKGIITTTDLLAFAASLPNEPDESSAEEQWNSGASPDWSEENEAPSAFFTEMWEDAGTDMSARFQGMRSSQWNVLEEHTVSEAMTRNPVFTLSPNSSVEEAAEFMRRTGVHRVLVSENGELAGIVSSMDLARAIAEHKLTSRTYTFGSDSAFDVRGWDLTEPRVPSGERIE